MLLALTALLAPRIEASRTSVWESNPPAAAVHTTTNAADLLAPLAPAGPLESIVADVEPVEPLRFDLGDVVLVTNPRHDHFRIGLADVVEPPVLRGPPLLDGDPHQAFELRDPETRIRGLELLPPFRIGASPTLSLWSRQACGFVCREVASDSRYDPWGLASDLDPRSNPDVAAALEEAQARAASAPVSRDWSIGPMSPPSPTAGAFWYGFDALTLGNFSAEGNRYGFLASSRSHAADDLVAFKRANPKVVLGLDAAAALAGPGKFLKAVGLVGALGSYAENTEAPEAAAPVAVASTYRGGPHSDTRLPAGDEMDSHHMPPRSVSPLDPKKGPAIKMDPPDHQLTSSFGGTREAQEYRAELKAMLAEGRWREVMAKEIKDVRRVAGKKYNQAVIEMLEYAKKLGVLAKKVPK